MPAECLGGAWCGHRPGLPRVPTLSPVIRAKMHLDLRATTHRWADGQLGPDSGGTFAHPNDAITIGPTGVHAETDAIVTNGDGRAGGGLVGGHGEVFGLR